MAKNSYRCRKRIKAGSRSYWDCMSLSEKIKVESQIGKKLTLKRKKRLVLQKVKYKEFIRKSNLEIEHMGGGIE